jgi:hypothetical protein
MGSGPDASVVTCDWECHAQMARHDSQLARGESASVFGGRLAAIHRMLLMAFLGHRGVTVDVPSVLPEVPKASGRKLGVSNRVLDVLVPEVVL